MCKLLLLLTLFVGSLGNAYDLVPPYRFRFGDDGCWECIYKNRPQETHDVPFFLKPPATFASGDQPMTLANKYMLAQTNYVVESMKKEAVVVAKDVAKEVSPVAVKAIDKATNTTMSAKTFSVTHNVRYDLPTGVALYTADAESMNFTMRHETFTSSDTMSIAYKLNTEENVGIRYTDTTCIYTLFLEGKW